MMLFSQPDCFYSHRTRIVLTEKDITAEIIDVDPDNQPEDLMDVNPYGVLPTLVDRDLVLYDSRIIMDYLDERFPHPPLLPVDPVSRARCRLALYRIEKDWYPLVEAIQENGKGVEQARKELTESIAATAPILEQLPFFLNEEFSLVDASIAPILWRLPSLGIELPKEAKAVEKYAESLFAREGFKLSLSEAETLLR
ncbi:glutathione S-transferase, N-terminal domain [gamma proteobacterium HTCC5015]|nr:glutathione S-transferase, N-terminal domain [gamma proteobacterium HTCC5015]